MTLKFVDEYRDADLAWRYSDLIKRTVTRPWNIMEACGGQTHSIVRYGIDRLLPDLVTLVHGPGCPVCVTPVSTIDDAIALAARPEVILCSFGDMLRVPGTAKDLQMARAEGGDVRVVYSPLEALALARLHPEREVVFFAIGFETTAPANAMAAWRAKEEGLENFSLLVSQVLVPPALEEILKSPASRINGFLAPGHVCTVAGFSEYEPLVGRYRVPIVVTGFEPADILQGLLMCLRQLEEGRAEVENQYTRSVRREGNLQAQAMLAEVFERGPKVWRGLGQLPESGFRLRPAYARFDAAKRFGFGLERDECRNGCISGLVLQGARKPVECPQFGKACNPQNPLGATMVSAEGACAAYFRYRWQEEEK
jgi:hydrogenase expression/formation protein HypD